MKINRRLISEARAVKTIIILSVCLGFIGGILGIMQAYSLSRVINQVFLQNGTLHSVSGMVLVILLIIALRAVFLYTGDLTANTAARNIKQSLRQKLFTHLYSLGPAYLHKEDADSATQTGELVNLASQGIDGLEPYFSQYIPQVALAVLVPISILVVVFPTDALSGLILLVTAPLIPIFMYLIGSAADQLTRKQWLGLSRMSAYFLDVLQGLATLKSLGRSKDQVRIIEKVSDQYRLTTMGVLRVTFLSALVLEMVATLSTAIVAVEIGIRLLYGRMAFEQAFFILLLAPEFYLPLRLLGTRFHASMAGVEAGKRIFQVLDTPGSVEANRGTEVPKHDVRENQPPSIVIKDLSFSYPGKPPTLDRISLEIPPGKMTALIGESGAGKTTLTWLLLRFLQPESGKVLVNGKPVEEIPADQWYLNLAWVPQNPYLFNDTIAANIALARPDAASASIQQAARLAHADEFIRVMPQGYETVIGERGARLSAGQAQRIALARAFLKDAPLLILDEATSHLDPLTDAHLQDAIKRLVHNRTVLVVAHRKSTLSRADQVIRISQVRSELSSSMTQLAESTIPLEEGRAPFEEEQPLVETTPNTELDNKGDLRVIRKSSLSARLLHLLAPFWSRILLSVFLGFATVASGIGLMATSAYIISAAALHPSIAELQVAIVGVRFFGIARGVFRYLERLVSHDVTFRLLARWRVRFYQALEPLAPARLLRYHSGDLLARVIQDIGTLENFYVRTVSPPIVALLVSAAVLIFMRGFGGGLAWGLLVFLILAGLALPVLAFFLSRRTGPSTVVSRGKLNSLLVDCIQGMPDLMTSGKVSAQIDRIRLAGEEVGHMQARMSGVTSLQTTLGTLLANLGMLTILILAIEMVSSQQLNGVLLGVVTLTALTCFEAMQPLPQVVQNLEANQASADRLYELVDAAVPVEDPPQPRNAPDDLGIELRNLSFQYPAWEQEPSNNPTEFTLKDISFSLPQGKHLALIGPSGVGKTTLVNILLRFWEYQTGSILLGGHELRDYRQDDIRERIAYISQNTYLFCATLKDNLLIAHPGASLEDLHQAVKSAQLEEFIESLPSGYDTWIGEHGLRLSAGERQRLALARAFLKRSPILILDEPTSNLDPANEHALLDSIHRISEGKSMIYITQNMVGLEAMDEILVLQDGQIVERGSHNKLLTNQGKYRQMWDLYHQIV
jgi:ATP-binding cassette, subfamily C, bacterial CydCD